MSLALAEVLLALFAAGALPALVVARGSAAALFLAPLTGAVLAAVAAELELGIGGSLLTWYVLAAVAANAAATAWWLAAGRRRTAAGGPSAGWYAAIVVVIALVLIVPLTALRVPMIGYDTNSIWLSHALMIAGGHSDLVAAVHNPVYGFAHLDYPPLVPATGALAFAISVPSNLRLAVDVTAILNACALGATAAGIATAAISGPARQRAVGVAAGACVCLAGFAVAGQAGVDGHADLLWAAAAVAAIIWGLVLPRSGQALGIAWICALAAGLSKNEGLTSAVIVLALISFRYRPLSYASAGRSRHGQGIDWRAAIRDWAGRAALAVVPALPLVAWEIVIRALGVGNVFFRTLVAPEPFSERASATFASTVVHLAVLPAALAALVAGCCFAYRDRIRAGLANPGWLWAAGLLAQGVISGIYVFGSNEIHRWLLTSVARTSTFIQILLYAELAIWLVIAFDGATRRSEDQPASSAVGEKLPLPQ